jgi:hypothetical protein
MLIIATAIASALCLMGVLLVGNQTAAVIAGMPPLRAQHAELTSFPADVEQQIAAQRAGAGRSVAVTRMREEDQLRQRLRERGAGLSVALAKARELAGMGPTADADEPVIEELYADLESLLVQQPGATDPALTEPLRELALRHLTGVDGTVQLPRFEIGADEGFNDARVGTLAEQLRRLQAGLNQQVRDSGVLEGREVDFDRIELSGDLGQLEAAIEALGLQRHLLGMGSGGSAEYSALRDLSAALLSGSGVSLDGLNADQLRIVAGDLLGQLGSVHGDPLGAELGALESELLSGLGDIDLGSLDLSDLSFDELSVDIDSL